MDNEIDVVPCYQLWTPFGRIHNTMESFEEITGIVWKFLPHGHRVGVLRSE